MDSKISDFSIILCNEHFSVISISVNQISWVIYSNVIHTNFVLLKPP